MRSILFWIETILRNQFGRNYLKNKKLFSIICCIFEMCIKFRTFSKKRWPSYLISFRNYALRKTWSNICPKSPVSKDPLTGNMVNGFKHCCDLDNSTALRKTWLDICPKSRVSNDPLTGNMVNAFKHCSDLEHSTVTIFTDHLEGIWVEKSLF